MKLVDGALDLLLFIRLTLRILTFFFRFEKARQLDEDAELPCLLALCGPPHFSF